MNQNRIHIPVALTMAAVTLAIGFVTLVSFFNSEIYWEDVFAPFESLENQCAYMISPTDNLKSIKDNSRAFKKITVPFRKAGFFPRAKNGEFLAVKCKVPTSGIQTGMAWLYLGPFKGSTFVYLNDREVMETSERTYIELPLSPSDLRMGESVLYLITKGDESLSSQGPSSLVPLLLSDSKTKIDIMQKKRLTTRHEIPPFGIGFCFALITIFGLAWIFGLRYPDIGWIISMVGFFSVSFFLTYPPLYELVGGTFSKMRGLLNMGIVSSIFCFLCSFYRTKNPIRYDVIFIALLAIYAIALYHATAQIYLDFQMLRKVPMAIGSFLAFSAGLIGIWDRLFVDKSKARNLRRILITALSFVTAVGLGSQIIIEQYNGINISWYLLFSIITTFSMITAFDIVVYRNRLLLERIDNQTNKAIAQTTQMISHDLRRPLKALQIVVNRLPEIQNPQDISERIQPMIPDIKQAIEGVKHMLEDVNEIGSQRTPHFETIRLRELIDESCQTLSYVKEVSKDVYRIQCEHNVYAKGDRIKLLRVFTNLIGNALDAREPGTYVNVSVLEQNKRVRIEVQNSGAAIPKDVQMNMFKPFFTANKPNGTGLGLAIVKKIAQEHGSEIGFKSEQRNGTRFYFYLQLGNESELLNSSISSNEVSLLIVDDDPFVIDLWQRSFPSYSINAVHSPEILQEKLLDEPGILNKYTCVIVDYYFDDSSLTGNEVIDFIRSANVDIPIFLSSFNPDGFDKSMSEKVAAILPKEPRSWEELQAYLNKSA